MEISNLNGSSTIGGISQPIISTRRVEHTIRLNDGEVNLLGGILEDQLTKTTSGTPFLGQIPLLKYIFSEEKKERVQNEIVFLLVPHIVRNQELDDLNKRAFDVGTGSGIDLHIAAQQPPRAEGPQVAAAPAQEPQTSLTARTAPPARPVAPATPARGTANESAQPPASTGAASAGTEAPASNSASGPMTLRLDPGTVTQKQGGTFSLNVVVAHGQDIASVPLQISYDPKVLQFVSVANGDYLSRDGQPAILVHRDDPASGKLQVTAQRQPGSAGVSGDGTVFTLVFNGKSKGDGTVAISVPGARNSKNQALEVLGSQATVKIE
jgi:general secretion pathway protein D